VARSAALTVSSSFDTSTVRSVRPATPPRARRDSGACSRTLRRSRPPPSPFVSIHSSCEARSKSWRTSGQGRSCGGLYATTGPRAAPMRNGKCWSLRMTTPSAACSSSFSGRTSLSASMAAPRRRRSAAPDRHQPYAVVVLGHADAEMSGIDVLDSLEALTVDPR